MLQPCPVPRFAFCWANLGSLTAQKGEVSVSVTPNVPQPGLASKRRTRTRGARAGCAGNLKPESLSGAALELTA